MQNRALIVESNLRSRRELVKDLTSAGVVEEIIEAESIRSGLETVRREPLAACFLGPKLQPSTALGFVTAARALPHQHHCAFVVVSNEQEALHRSELSRAVDITISYPYSKQTFCDTISRTITRTQTAPRPKPTPPVEQILFSLAADLRSVARQIVDGELALDRTGAPAADTARAIREAFKKLSSSSSLESDEFFIRSLSAWFTDRTRTTNSRACQMLRERLREM